MSLSERSHWRQPTVATQKTTCYGASTWEFTAWGRALDKEIPGIFPTATTQHGVLTTRDWFQREMTHCRPRNQEEQVNCLSSGNWEVQVCWTVSGKRTAATFRAPAKSLLWNQPLQHFGHISRFLLQNACQPATNWTFTLSQIGKGPEFLKQQGGLDYTSHNKDIQ